MSYNKNKEKTFEEVEEETPKIITERVIPPGQSTASGYCESCHNRYNNVPVIKGNPQCPTCTKA